MTVADCRAFVFFFIFAARRQGIFAGEEASNRIVVPDQSGVFQPVLLAAGRRRTADDGAAGPGGRVRHPRRPRPVRPGDGPLEPGPDGAPRSHAAAAGAGQKSQTAPQTEAVADRQHHRSCPAGLSRLQAQLLAQLPAAHDDAGPGLHRALHHHQLA